MANNVNFKDASNVSKTFKTTETGTTHVPHHNVDTVGSGTATIGAIFLSPSTGGGCSTYYNVDLDETGISVKGTPGQIYGWYVTNHAMAPRYIKLYNKATAPTVGSDTPVMTISIPAGTSPITSEVADFTNGIAFSLGIGIGATTGKAHADTGAPAVGDVMVSVFYK